MTIKERNPDGTIKKSQISSEEARDMQSKRWSKAKEDSADSLLKEAGYSDDNPAPEHLKVLAEMAASQKASAVAAMRDFVRLTARTETASKVGKPAPGEICPLCDELVLRDFRPDASQLQLAADYLDRYTPKQPAREQQAETGNPFKGNGE